MFDTYCEYPLQQSLLAEKNMMVCYGFVFVFFSCAAGPNGKRGERGMFLPLTLDISLLFGGILTQEAYHFSFALAKDIFIHGA